MLLLALISVAAMQQLAVFRQSGVAAPPTDAPPSESSDAVSSDLETSASAKRAVAALQSLNGVIGEWRGVGQVRRGSSQGAWKQTSEFVWDFTSETPAIRYIVKEGELVDEGRLTWNAETNEITLSLKTPEGESRSYSGTWKDGRLTLVSPADGEGRRHRMTITPLNEKRTLVLHEQTLPNGDAFLRVAEIGSTREGTRLANSGTGQRECIVTGGTGTMEVSYEGKTYFVCCTGCRQAFEDDPAGIIAEFRARLEERKRSAGQ